MTVCFAGTLKLQNMLSASSAERDPGLRMSRDDLQSQVNKQYILLRYNSLPCGTECCSRMAARHQANV